MSIDFMGQSGSCFAFVQLGANEVDVFGKHVEGDTVLCEPLGVTPGVGTSRASDFHVNA